MINKTFLINQQTFSRCIYTTTNRFIPLRYLDIKCCNITAAKAAETAAEAAARASSAAAAAAASSPWSSSSSSSSSDGRSSSVYKPFLFTKKETIRNNLSPAAPASAAAAAAACAAAAGAPNANTYGVRAVQLCKYNRYLSSFTAASAAGAADPAADPAAAAAAAAAAGEGGGIREIKSKDFSCYNVPLIRWGEKTIDFYICGINPEGEKEGKYSCYSGVYAAQVIRPDLFMIGLGYLDIDKLINNININKLINNNTNNNINNINNYINNKDINKLINKDNGQFIPLFFYIINNNIPFYLIGRDRLIEMGKLGEELIKRPIELYTLFINLLMNKLYKLYKFNIINKIINNNNKKELLSPSLIRVLTEEGSKFSIYKIHQLLLSWSDLPPAYTPQPEQDFEEKTFIRKWLIGRNSNECALMRRAQELEKGRLPLPNYIKKKKKIKILIVCDVAIYKRLTERINKELNNYLLYNNIPFYKQIYTLQDTSSTFFHLCLFIYFLLPLLSLAKYLFNKIKKAFLQFAVVDATVSVGGDEVLARLTAGGGEGGEEEEQEEEKEGEKGEKGKKEKKKEGGKNTLQIVESRWLGLKHTVRDTSRD